MPAKNSIQIYVENSYYHLYNRGVAKQDIFRDDQDYSVLISYIKLYLTSPDQNQPLQRLKNYSNQIDFLAYCLMPNHYHFLVKQAEKDTIQHFMKSVSTKYTMYFNKKYKRVGTIFQGRYKGIRVETDEQLLHLSRYIHLNPGQATKSNPAKYPYSSYRNYLGKLSHKWLKYKSILHHFSSGKKLDPSHQKYRAFVENNKLDISCITKLTLEKLEKDQTKTKQ